MATLPLLLSFLLLVFYMTLALPTSRDLSVSDVGLKSEDGVKTEPALSFDLKKVLLRTRRDAVRGKGCPRGKVFFKRKCITYKRYKAFTEGDYDEE